MGELEPLWEVFAQVACKTLPKASFQMAWVVAVDQFCWTTKRPDWYRADLHGQFEAIWDGLLQT